MKFDTKPPAQRLLLAFFLLCALPLPGFSWGGRLHMDINRAAARNVPDEMAAWRRYAQVLAAPGIYPDLWKGEDPNEGPRHYIDAELYAVVGVANLPRDYDRLPRADLPKHSVKDGLAPWVILQLQERLTAAMATNDWDQAAAVAAALGHYVGDIHQPLHTTENYDGATTANAGVHLRWEITLPASHWRGSMISAGDARYLEDAWPEILAWINASHARFEDILTADKQAIAATDSNESSAYFDRLWALSSTVFREQASAAAEHLSSLWYTAWVNAGKPPIPPPPEKIPETSIWQAEKVIIQPSPLPFFIAFIVAALLIVVLSVRKQRKASLPVAGAG